jgi:undecaprenyl pyrophosphate synthase
MTLNSGLISSEINENQFVKYLTTADIPDPELLITDKR